MEAQTEAGAIAASAPLDAPVLDSDRGGALAAFRSHFFREPDIGNPHDLGCLLQIDLFYEKFGRMPDTSSRADLRELQLIELNEHPDPVRRAIESPRGRRIDELEVAMMHQPGAERGLKHLFVPGMYVRELTTPAGVLSVSKVHRFEHPFVISKGRVTMFTEDGPLEICAPFTGVTKAGTRRISYFHEETVWTTFHVTAGLGLKDETDLAEIEAAIIETHREHLEGLVQPKPLPGPEGVQK